MTDTDKHENDEDADLVLPPYYHPLPVPPHLIQKAPPGFAPKSRNPGCDRLARLHPSPEEHRAEFFEEDHKYKIDGQTPQRSCTGVLHQYFEEFDPWKTVNMYYKRWKQNRDARYWPIIALTEADSGNGRITDAEAKQRIVTSWTSIGPEAARLGTLFHLYCEELFNRAPWAPYPDCGSQRFAEVAKEVAQHKRFMASDFVRKNNLVPYGTEYIVWWKREGRIVCAGQVDALMVDAINGLFYLFDWKRTNKKHELCPNARAFRKGSGICCDVPDTDYHKYSLQTCLYAAMLKHAHGLDVADRLYLVRVHEDRDDYQLVKCHDWRGKAYDLLDAEYQRLQTLEQ